MNPHACDTPAKIAIIGAGPIGLEAALYARFLGYEVAVYERDEVGAAVRTFAEGPRAGERLGAFANLHSTLGLAALESQDERYAPPAGDEEITATQWLDRYLWPLAATDLLDGCLCVGTEVVRIGTVASDEQMLEGAEEAGPEANEAEERAPDRFELQIHDAERGEAIDRAAVVIDATGPGSIEVPRRQLADRSALAVDVALPHPHFHLLGFNAKDGRPFSFVEGLTQIRLLFSLIGDRESLDLYAGAHSLLKPRE